MVGGLIFFIVLLVVALVGVMWNNGKKDAAEQNADKTMVFWLILSGVVIFLIFVFMSGD